MFFTLNQSGTGTMGVARRPIAIESERGKYTSRRYAIGYPLGDNVEIRQNMCR